jgi:hypothetical protein
MNKGCRARPNELTHLHPMQLRIIVWLGETGEHKVIRVLEEGACAEAGWGEHGSVQGSGRLVLLRMWVRRWLLMVLCGRRGRGRRRWEVFASLVDDAQLNDGWWVDWPSIGCQRARQCERPHSMATQKKNGEKKKKKEKKKREKTKQ